MNVRLGNLARRPGAALLLVLLAGSPSGCGPSPSNLGTAMEPRTEAAQGPIRVILLRACPVEPPTVPPTFVVTYAVEIPREGAFADLHVGEQEEVILRVNGKPVEATGGRSSGSMAYEDLPRRSELRRPTPRDGSATLCEDVVFTGLRLEAPRIDLQIRFAWRGSPMTFEFNDVPVGFRNAANSSAPNSP